MKCISLFWWSSSVIHQANESSIFFFISLGPHWILLLLPHLCFPVTIPYFFTFPRSRNFLSQLKSLHLTKASLHIRHRLELTYNHSPHYSNWHLTFNTAMHIPLDSKYCVNRSTQIAWHRPTHWRHGTDHHINYPHKPLVYINQHTSTPSTDFHLQQLQELNKTRRDKNKTEQRNPQSF